jgi:hypothetical protein
MPTFTPNVRLIYEPNTAPGTLYDECRRCERKTNTSRKITRQLRGCAKKSLAGSSSPRS